MMVDELYDRIKNFKVRSIAFDLYNQISRKGSTKHKIIGSISQHLFMYSHLDEIGKPEDVTYQQFKSEYSDDFKIHMGVLNECLDAGFRI